MCPAPPIECSIPRLFWIFAIKLTLPARKRRVAKTWPAALPKGRRPSKICTFVEIVMRHKRSFGSTHVYGK
jgi:hypothetical protein